MYFSTIHPKRRDFKNTMALKSRVRVNYNLINNLPKSPRFWTTQIVEKKFQWSNAKYADHIGHIYWRRSRLSNQT